MDYVPPVELVKEAVKVGEKKSGLKGRDMLIRGFLSGVEYVTSFAFTVSNGFSGGAATLVSAAFSIGFAMIVLLGLEQETLPC